MMRLWAVLGAIALSACGAPDAGNQAAGNDAAGSAAGGDTVTKPSAATHPQDQFLANLAGHCGKSYAGRVVTTDPADADFANKPLVMHVAACEQGRVRVPFHVGDDHSRTWVLTRTPTGTQLKHDHRHADGSSDVLTMYGGDTTADGTAQRLEFPVDAKSIALFRANGSERSVTNIWAMELTDSLFAYELRRANRHFRVEFDLTKPVATPPMPWGWKD